MTSLLPVRSTQVRRVKFAAEIAGEKKVSKWTGMGAIPVIFGEKKLSPFHIILLPKLRKSRCVPVYIDDRYTTAVSESDLASLRAAARDYSDGNRFSSRP